MWWSLPLFHPAPGHGIAKRQEGFLVSIPSGVCHSLVLVPSWKRAAWAILNTTVMYGHLYSQPSHKDQSWVVRGEIVTDTTWQAKIRLSHSGWVVSLKGTRCQ